MFTNLGSVLPASSGSFVVSGTPASRERPHVAVAADAGGSSASRGLRGGLSTGIGIGTTNHITSIEELLPVADPRAMRRLCRSLYKFDNVLGSAADLMSALPFSDFVLTGVPDPEMLRVFATSCENMKIKTYLPEMLKSYNVDGVAVSALNYDKDTDHFSAILPLDPDWCETTPLPVFGMDPLIDVSLPKTWQELLRSKDPRLKNIRRFLPDAFEKSKNGKVALEPASTLYLERRGLGDSGPTSYFQRALPICLLEKTLLQGTIESAQRRQRALLHVQADDPDALLDQAGMADLGNLFQKADLDPLSGIVVTRGNIMVNEVRSGADFWKYDDIYDMASGAKMRALGISEAFLSGDATFNTMDSALTVFLENLRALRDFITMRVFYHRIFPILAMAHGFTKETKSVVTGSTVYRRGDSFEVLCAGGVPSELDLSEFNSAEFYIPKLDWLKNLRPEADSAYLDILGSLTSRGLPIPLRVWAAAGGVNLSQLMAGLDEDVQLHKRIEDYKKKLPKSAQEGDEELASLKTALASTRRDFSEVEMVDPKTRRILSRKGRQTLEEKINRRWSKVLAHQGQRHNFSQKQREAARPKTRSFYTPALARAIQSSRAARS